jgi:hypothetical protein
MSLPELAELLRFDGSLLELVMRRGRLMRRNLRSEMVTVPKPIAGLRAQGIDKRRRRSPLG